MKGYCDHLKGRGLAATRLADDAKEICHARTGCGCDTFGGT